MNKAMLMGRLVRDPETRYSQGGNQTAICRYTLAVDRPKDKNGERKADFINCIAFGNRGEFAQKYLKKGTQIAVCGRIQTGSYEKNGQKVYTTDIIVDEHYFCGSGNGQNNAATQQQRPNIDDFAPTNEAAPGQWTSPSYSGQQQGMNDGFMPIDEEIDSDSDLPF